MEGVSDEISASLAAVSRRFVLFHDACHDFEAARESFP
jgi:hypothetical protein